MKNPFDASNGAGGALPRDQFATHTWDIVALLGRYDELLDEKQLRVIRRWRDCILDFVHEKDEGMWPAWDEMEGHALRVNNDGLKVQRSEEYLDQEDGGRRRKLLDIAVAERAKRDAISCGRVFVDVGLTQADIHF